MASDTLSQSVTVNTRVAIDLIQQMWSSPCTGNSNKYRLQWHFFKLKYFYTDKTEALTSEKIKPISEENVPTSAQCLPNFIVYEDNKSPIKSQVNDNVFKAQHNNMPIQNNVSDNNFKFKSNKASNKISEEIKPTSREIVNNSAQCPPIFKVYEDNNSPIKNQVINNVSKAQQNKNGRESKIPIKSGIGDDKVQQKITEPDVISYNFKLYTQC